MKESAGKRRRFGILPERKGMLMKHKKLYWEEGLSVQRRRGRKRGRASCTPMPGAAHPNARWPLDFLADSFGASRRFRILAVVDDCCRENLCLTADTRISGARVARELVALVRIYEKPGCIVSDRRPMSGNSGCLGQQFEWSPVTGYLDKVARTGSEVKK